MGSEKGRLRIEYVSPDVLRPFEGNPRTISERGLEKLRRSVEEFGFTNPILVQRGTNMIIAGHQRLKAAKAAGLTEVPVIYLDMDDVTAKAYNIADNRLAEEADWDFGPLSDLLAELKEDKFDLSLVGFDEDELERLLHWSPAATGPIGDDEVPEPPAEPITKPGDLWILGRHRLLCGDATNATDVERLLAGARPLLMVTDPPYGVEYDPSWRNEAAKRGAIDFAARREGTVQNDDRADWYDAWALFPGDVAYVWHAGRHSVTVQMSLERAGFEVRSQIIWAKPRFAISRGHYHWQHEPCWYAVRKGQSARWIGDRSQSTLWQIPMLDDEDQKIHGTQKPTECMARPIRNHAADEVYDPFVGSGTTLVAAERLGRTCYAMEIDPRYCDVVVQRWERLTGQKAVLEDGSHVNGKAARAS